MKSSARWLVLLLFALGGVSAAVVLALFYGNKQATPAREMATGVVASVPASDLPPPMEEATPFRATPLAASPDFRPLPPTIDPRPQGPTEPSPLKPILAEPAGPIAQNLAADSAERPPLALPDSLSPRDKATLEPLLKKTSDVLRVLEDQEIAAGKGTALDGIADKKLNRSDEKKSALAKKLDDPSDRSPPAPQFPSLDNPKLPAAGGNGNGAKSATNGGKEKDGREKETAKSTKGDRNRITRVPGEGDDHLSIHIQEMDLRDVLDLLSEQGGLNILAANSVQGKVSASLKNVDIDAALNAILRQTGFTARRDGRFVYVGTPADFQTMEQNLDRVGTRIYRPNYVRAAEVQHLITPLLTPGVGTVSVTNQSETGIAADNTKAGGDNFAGGEAVLVKDYEAVLAQVDQIITEIDKRPMQVHIEAMILSVKLDDEHTMGVDFELLRRNNHVKLASGSPLSDLGQVSFKDGGLKFGFLDSNLGLFVNALETIGDTNVIATPRLLCLNKQRSEILIGAQLGYVSTTVTETSTSQKVEFLEIGTQLRLRPFISNDGLIRMEVHPELSTGSVQLKGNFTLPEKDVTQVTTNIMCRDGCTVIIGGLIRSDLNTTGSQIPLLGNLPGVGPLFRNRKESTQRSEILVLITPHIVYDDACGEGDRAACEFKRRQNVYADEMCPIGKRYIGRKYFRLAQQAFAKGDDERALRFADLAIHFDPISREAIDLRADIWHGNHNGQFTGPQPKSIGTLQVVEGQPTPRWLLNGDTSMPHPRDPGTPGSSRTIDKPQQFR